MSVTKTYSLKHEASAEAEATITGTIPADQISKQTEEALESLSKSMEIDGFRKGKAPKAEVAKRLGPVRLATEAAELTLQAHYPEMLAELKLSPLGRPQVSVTKVVPGEAVEFKITTALMPEVELGDYKKAAKEVEKETTEVTEKEVDEAILELRRHIKHSQDQAKAAESEESTATEDSSEDKDEDLPEITDELAKQLLGVDTAAAVRERVEAEIKATKEQKAKEKVRLQIIESIIAASTFKIPKIVVESELEAMMDQFNDDIKRMGMAPDEYLKHIKKTRDDLRRSWEDDALKRAQLQLVLVRIAEAENISPDKEAVEKNLEMLKERFKDDQSFSEQRAKLYLENQLTNEAVFQWLEGLK